MKLTVACVAAAYRQCIRQENEQLRLALAGLVRLLAARNILTNGDVAHILGLVESSGDA